MLVGQKLGMTRFWWEDVYTPITVIRVLPQWVLDLRADQGGRPTRRTVWGFVKARRAKLPLLGELAKAFGEEIRLFALAVKRGEAPSEEVVGALRERFGPWADYMISRKLVPGRGIYEAPVPEGVELSPGQEIGIFDVFPALKPQEPEEEEEKAPRPVILPRGAFWVDVTGRSKGRGFAGVMKRWDFAGGPASHGSKFHRRPGSIGQHTEPAKVWKGKKMAGHYGDERITVLALALVGAIPEDSLLLVRGGVPGAKGSVVFVRPSVRRKSNA